MNLGELRAEVANHGFDPDQFGQTRIDQFLNDGYQLALRRVNYYTQEMTSPLATVGGTATYPLPTGFDRERTIFDTDRHLQLQVVLLSDIDRSDSSRQGAPLYYALDAGNVHLFPTPDGVYNLAVRYWAQPTTLVADVDAPTIPTAWHRLLWYWAVKECYAAEDDVEKAQYWEQQFNTTLAEFSADVKFPGELPMQVRGMWDQDGALPSAVNLW